MEKKLLKIAASFQQCLHVTVALLWLYKYSTTLSTAPTKLKLSQSVHHTYHMKIKYSHFKSAS